MKRRLFLKSSALSALAAPAFAQNGFAAAPNEAASKVFYDARFSQARMLASRLSVSGTLTPVTENITAAWVKDFERLAAKPLALGGVTTESFFFCLKTLLQPHGLTFTRIERLGPDLHAWELRTGITNRNGTA